MDSHLVNVIRSSWTLLTITIILRRHLIVRSDLRFCLLFCFFLQRSRKDEGAGLTCLQPSCGLSMQPSEVNRRLREIRASLEKAVDLMERERPGD